MPIKQQGKTLIKIEKDTYMKVVFAMDSMKGSLSSIDFGNAAAEGLKRAIPDAEYEVKPLADGGEGTVNALTMGMGGSFENIEVTGPLGTKILTTYGNS